MTTSIAELPALIQRLIEQRDLHAGTIMEIDSTLAKVNDALGLKLPTKAGRKPNDPVSVPVSKSTVAPKTRKRRRSKFAVSGSESVLAFVGSAGSPTTAEIKQHWIGEGRAGGIDNTLSILTKQKKLQRSPLGKGIRGSRYSIA